MCKNYGNKFMNTLCRKVSWNSSLSFRLKCFSSWFCHLERFNLKAKFSFNLTIWTFEYMKNQSSYLTKGKWIPISIWLVQIDYKINVKCIFQGISVIFMNIYLFCEEEEKYLYQAAETHTSKLWSVLYKLLVKVRYVW